MSVVDITRAWLVAREVFGMRVFWQQVEALAGAVDVDARIAVVLEARKLMERATRWLLMNRRPPFGIAETVSFLGGASARSARRYRSCSPAATWPASRSGAPPSPARASRPGWRTRWPRWCRPTPRSTS